MRAMTNFLRWLVYVPLIIVAFYLIDLGFGWLVQKAVGMKTIWLILIVILFSTFIIGLFSVLLGILTSSLFTIPPNKKIGGIVFSSFSAIMLISSLIGYWQVDASFVGKLIIESQVLLIWGGMIKFGMDFSNGDFN